MFKYKLYILILLAFTRVQLAGAQAHLGSTEFEIKALYPEKKWTVNYTTKAGIKYISTEMVYGNFLYYFDTETKLSNLCLQFPSNNTAMNAQIEAYNKKYVITSDRTWTAYLEEGGIMYISLIYDRENRLSYFKYSNTK